MPNTTVVRAALAVALVAAPGAALADQHPDLIVHNARIITVDDPRPNNNPGTIAQAMAVRDGVILRIGSNDDVLGLRGTDTRVLDVQGRTILPGFVDIHFHPQDSMERNARRLYKLPQQVVGYHINLQVAATADETLAKIGRAVDALMNRVEIKPDDWIGIVLLPNRQTRFGDTGSVSFLMASPDPADQQISKEDLTEIIPSNPAVLMSGASLVNVPQTGVWYRATLRSDGSPVIEEVMTFEIAELGPEIEAVVAVDRLWQREGWERTRWGHRARMLNDEAIKRILKVWPNLEDGIDASTPVIRDAGERVIMTTSPPWSHFERVLLKPAPTVSQLADGAKMTLESKRREGVTQFESRLDSAEEVSAFNHLFRREGRLPVRFAWHYEQHRTPIFDHNHVRLFYKDRGVTWTPMELGNRWMWLGGVGSEGDGDSVNKPCFRQFFKLKDPRAEVCPDFNTPTTQAVLVGALEAGWRFVGMHGVGPGMISIAAEQVEKARKVNGLTLDDIRAMRHTFAHGHLLGKDPELIEIAKKYNFTLVIAMPRALRDEPPFIDRYMGPDGYRYLAPIRSLVEAGVRVAVEFGGFEGLESVVTRREPLDTGKVWVPEETVDRVTALKLVTTWSAYSLFSESLTGSLEAGKLADFIVIEKDYLSGPDSEISENKVLMTVVDGDVGYTAPEFKPAWAQ
jgi:predicted amidohydrolase YtcJ